MGAIDLQCLYRWSQLYVVRKCSGKQIWLNLAFTNFYHSIPLYDLLRNECQVHDDDEPFGSTWGSCVILHSTVTLFICFSLFLPVMCPDSDHPDVLFSLLPSLLVITSHGPRCLTSNSSWGCRGFFLGCERASERERERESESHSNGHHNYLAYSDSTFPTCLYH